MTQGAPSLTNSVWMIARDGDPRARALYERHYSCRKYKDGRRPKRFAGPGEKLVLLTPEADALLVWRKFRSMDNQCGVSCAVFRNESRYLSSELIRQAMMLAWQRWPGERLYTYVNPKMIESVNPGFCFKVAGWRFCGLTKKGLHILEILPSERTEDNMRNNMAAWQVVATKVARVIEVETQKRQAKAEKRAKLSALLDRLAAEGLREYASRALGLEIEPSGNTFPLTADGDIVLYAEQNLSLPHDFDPDDGAHVQLLKSKPHLHRIYIKPSQVQGEPYDSDHDYPDLPRFNSSGEPDEAGNWVGLRLDDIEDDDAWTYIAAFVYAWNNAKDNPTKRVSKVLLYEQCKNKVFGDKHYAWADVQTLNELYAADVDFGIVNDVGATLINGTVCVLIEVYS